MVHVTWLYGACETLSSLCVWFMFA
jgi:hypothetical protein